MTQKFIEEQVNEKIENDEIECPSCGARWDYELSWLDDGDFWCHVCDRQYPVATD